MQSVLRDKDVLNILLLSSVVEQMWITLRRYLICLDCEAKSDVIDQIDLTAIRMAIKTTTAPGVRTEN